MRSLPILDDDEPVDVDTEHAAYNRPRTRGDCRMGPRPCPWASCRHHLYLEVHAESGELLSAHREIDDLPETCSLDVAERGDPLMLEEVGELLNVTRERVRQLEEQGMVHLVRELKRAGYDLDELVRDE